MYQHNTTTSGSTALFTSFSSPQPSATITKGRGRLKTYGSNVYLKDGSNFEIELYNPKTTSVLAKIWINGQVISAAGGIVLRPGQRVFLERFIDVTKKFKFTVYEVDDSTQSQAAIVNNGKVEVQFYDELVYLSQPSIMMYGNGSTVTTNYYTHTPGVTYANSIIGGSASTFTNSSIETGIVEKGPKSKQKFSSISANFNSWTCSISVWIILPESKKPVEIGEIRSYCTNCGTRNKKSSWKFCPNCGTQISE